MRRLGAERKGLNPLAPLKLEGKIISNFNSIRLCKSHSDPRTRQMPQLKNYGGEVKDDDFLILSRWQK